MTPQEILPQDWPLRDHSRYVRTQSETWHIQNFGVGPKLLFLHGAGSSAHSWAEVAGALAPEFECLLIDLPGHALTQTTNRFHLSLKGMTEAILAFLKLMSFVPDAIISHSAGSAIGTRLGALYFPEARHVALNGAYFSFDGFAGAVFPLMAKALAFTPYIGPRISQRFVRNLDVRSLLSATQSAISDSVVARYEWLITQKSHIEGTLGMMASWDLKRELPAFQDIRNDMVFFQVENDGTVPFAQGRPFRKKILHAQTKVFESGGHILHETEPEKILPDLRDALLGRLNSR